jgi:hypothetical protein
MKTLKELNEELDALNALMNDETDDSPELLAEQERLLNAIIAAEAADLGVLTVKQLTAHFAKRAPSEHLAKGLSKAQLIAKIEALPPLVAPEPDPTPEPTPAAEPEPTPQPFSVAAYAALHGLDARELRKKLRAADCALRTPLSSSRKWWDHERRHDHLHQRRAQLPSHSARRARRGCRGRRRPRSDRPPARHGLRRPRDFIRRRPMAGRGTPGLG